MTEFEERVDDAERVAREASASPVVQVVARSGYVASALLRAMIGALALLLAAKVEGAHPGTQGAFGAIRAVPGGVVLLLLVAGGNGALFLWLVVQGALVRHPLPLERWRQRLVLWGRSVVYAAVGLTALRFALGAKALDDADRAAAGRRLFDLPGGQLALGLGGAVVVAIGAVMVWLGVSQRFVRTIRLPEGAGRRRAVLALGSVAYVAQGATILLVGITLLFAAWTVDAERIGGLDAALAGFSGSAFGEGLLVAVGVGWVVAGAYALVRARIADTA